MRLTLRHLVRTLRASPLSAGAAVLMLAATFGVGTTLFALLDSVVLTKPPFYRPESLVLAGAAPIRGTSASPRPVSWRTFERWREQRHVLEQAEAFDPTNMTLTGRGSAERVSVTAVTPGFFSLLGVTPQRGQLWTTTQQFENVVLVSERFWDTHLHRDPNAVGTALILGGQSYTVLGVLPRRFTFGLDRADLWCPLRPPHAGSAGEGPTVRVVARTVPGLAADQVSEVLQREAPPSTPSIAAVAALTQLVAGPLRTLLPALLVAASIASALALFNLTTLLAVRAAARTREFAVRRALGASRRHVAGQLLLEAHALVACGAAGGMLLAMWLTPLAGHLASEQFRTAAAEGLTLGWRSIATLGAAALVCAWLCGLPVAARALRTPAGVPAFRSTAGAGETLFRRILVAGELSLAFALFASLASAAGSLQRAAASDVGFAPAGVTTAGVSLPGARYPDDDAVSAFYRRLDEALTARFGRSGVALIDELPLTGDSGRRLVGAAEAEMTTEAVQRAAGPGYFPAMRIPLLEGRGFAASDDGHTGQRIMISRALAVEMFGDAPAAGRRLWLRGLGPAEVIGVVGDVRHRTVDESPVPTVYVSAWHFPSPTSRVVVRSREPHSTVISAMRDIVRRLDADLPVYAVQTMTDVVRASPGMAERRVAAWCLVAFAALAVTVAVLGVFGVLTHEAARRRLEFAIRVALGADRYQVSAAMLSHTATFVVAALVAGSVLAMVGIRLLGGVVPGIDAGDPRSLAGAAAAILALAALAAVPPLWRLWRIEPAAILRGE